MSLSASPARHIAPLIWLGTLLPSALVAAVFAPAADQPAVLYPLGGKDPVEAIGWGKDHGAPFLGLSDWGDAAILHLPSQDAALAALGSGFLPIGVDRGICGGTAQTTERLS
ncbi:hypothetical protein [Altererythrobacter lauratis]|uniref:Uncharacterized protein n=1 Tax=Alteraurantiacibacter lauratis TaxID=2054627 RepID=A0ABV7EG08_9SPHN